MSPAKYKTNSMKFQNVCFKSGLTLIALNNFVARKEWGYTARTLYTHLKM